MPVSRLDPFMSLVGNAQGYGVHRFQEQQPDPRTQAIEKYMQEQGNNSRLQEFDELEPRGGTYPQNEWDTSGVPRSVNENNMARQDYEDELLRRQQEPYRGPVQLYRGRRANAR